MLSRPVCSTYSKYLAEHVTPDKGSIKGPRMDEKKLQRDSFSRVRSISGRPESAGDEVIMNRFIHGSTQACTLSRAGWEKKRPNTVGGETEVGADDQGTQGRAWINQYVKECPFTITGLVPAMHYKVRVTARTLAGYGPPSREVLLTTKGAPPSEPPRAPAMVSATPSSITVGWVPPMFENGSPITGYEIQHLIVSKEDPDKEIDTEGIMSVGISIDTVSTETTEEENSLKILSNILESSNNLTSSPNLHDGSDCGLGPPTQNTVDDKHSKVQDRSKQVGMWYSIRAKALSLYSTVESLPHYCRAKFRMRAMNEKGWGEWSPISDELEAQDVITPVQKGPSYMVLRWFNRPEGNVALWELSRRVCRF
ncbi:unnamed protein product, partial [Choristocarpus tenellus]